MGWVGEETDNKHKMRKCERGVRRFQHGKCVREVLDDSNMGKYVREVLGDSNMGKCVREVLGDSNNL